MGPSEEERERDVILISDDEDDGTLGNSVLIVDPLGEYCALFSSEVLQINF